MKKINIYLFEKFKINKDIINFDEEAVKKKLDSFGIDTNYTVGKVFLSWCKKHNISDFNIYSHFDFNLLLKSEEKMITDWKEVTTLADKLCDDVHKNGKGKWWEVGDKLCYETDKMIGIGSLENNKFRNAVILKAND